MLAQTRTPSTFRRTLFDVIPAACAFGRLPDYHTYVRVDEIHTRSTKQGGTQPGGWIPHVRS